MSLDDPLPTTTVRREYFVRSTRAAAGAGPPTGSLTGSAPAATMHLLRCYVVVHNNLALLHAVGCRAVGWVESTCGRMGAASLVVVLCIGIQCVALMYRCSCKYQKKYMNLNITLYMCQLYLYVLLKLK